jgi:endonuclease G
MKLKLLLFISGLSLFLASCKKDGLQTNPIDPSTVVTPASYSITEDFETGSKTAYAAANVNLKTGSWNFDDALIGNLAADSKNGNWAVRIKNGSITMNFDVSGIDRIIIKHAKYTGADVASAWQLMMSKDQGKTYVQVGSDINENNAKLVTDSFFVAATGPVRFQIRKTLNNTGNRINIDDITFKGIGNSGVTVGSADTNPVDTTATGTATATRGVIIGTDAPPQSFSADNSNLLFGNPSGANNALLDNYLLNQGYYVESYSAPRGTPNWVSWHLDASNTTNATARLDNFAGFNGLPSSAYVVQSNSYSGSGFDRGHNCPSADRTSSVNANSATFLMTNMIPQAPQNNQQTWNNLEGYLRNQISSGNEVYIIMGSYGTGGVGSKSTAIVPTIDNGHVTVPSNVWKVAVIIPAGNGDLLRVTNTTRVIAVNTPNVNSINADWTKYIVSVRDIEKATGYNLLSNLPQSVQDAIEVKVDSGI